MSHCPRFHTLLLATLLLCLFSTVVIATETETAGKQLIASAPLDPNIPGNTLEAITLAALGAADAIELDLVVTEDQRLIAFHDINLARFTDVADFFPDRSSDDGRYLSPDFSILDIRRLRRITSGPDIAPAPPVTFAIPTFEDCLSLVRLLEKRLGRDIGLAINVVAPAAHRAEQIDISTMVLQTLHNYGYGIGGDALMLLSMDSDELQRIKKELLPAMKMEIPLYQRIGRMDGTGDNSLDDQEQNWMLTRIGTRLLASYAAGVVLHNSFLQDQTSIEKNKVFLENLRALDLKVFTFGEEADSQTDQNDSAFLALADLHLEGLGVDGIFTANYEKIRAHLKARMTSSPDSQQPALPVLPLQPLQVESGR